MNQPLHPQRRALRFRRFTNKAYAAFVSMHREVTIGRVSRAVCNLELMKAGRAFLLAGGLMMASLAGWAEETDTPEGVPLDAFLEAVDLPEAVITARRADELSGSFHLVATLSALDIAGLPVSSLSELLTYLPGLDVRQRGAAGTQTDISMRGGTFDQVLILLNGVPLNDAQTGHYTMNLPLPVSLIERIEILESCGASVFGVNAFSGAVNIITRREGTQYFARLTAGMNGLVNPEFSASFSPKVASSERGQGSVFHYNLAAEYNHAAGYYAPSPSEKEKTALRNSDYRIANIYAEMLYRGLDIQLGLQYKDIGAGMYYGFGSQDQFDATRTGLLSARYRRQWKAFSLDVQGSYRLNYDHYQWHRGQELYANCHRSHNAALAARAAYASRIGRTTLGVEARNEHLRSTNLGDTLHGNNRLHVNYLVAQSFIYRDLSAAIGLSGNYATAFGHHLTGSANIGYRFLRDGQVYINANRSLRLPTFTDLYYDAGNQKGDPALKPETAWTLAAGLKYAQSFAGRGQLQLGADGWFRWGENIIDWVYTPDDTRRPFHASNHHRTRSAGLETMARYTLNRWLPCVALSYAYAWMDLDLVGVGSRYLDVLRHQLTLHLEHGICDFGGKKGNIGASWTLRYRDRLGQYNNAEGLVCDYEPVLLLDGMLFWQNDFVKISASCTNITNRHYYDYGGILQPGAWAKGSVEVRL